MSDLRAVAEALRKTLNSPQAAKHIADAREQMRLLLAALSRDPTDEEVARELAAAWGDGINSIQWAGDIVAAVNAARERAWGLR